MATEHPISRSNVRTPTESGIADVARAILAPIASLKLTVGLLVLAVLVIFIGTLEQTRHDIDTVKHRHFLEGKVFVEIPLETFAVPAWFPNMQRIPGSIWIPSGMTILVLMIFNLAAAHVLRFRLHATGLKLVIGILAALIAGAVTWAIIFNGQNPDGMQGEPPISWEMMWVALQIVILGIACAAAFGFFAFPRNRYVERLLLALSAITFGVVLTVTLVMGQDAFIGDSAMRIVWQLAQSTVAASASLVACMILFKRKAGIVLLHLGVAGLMANEVYVNLTNEEHRMTIMEGDTVSTAIDIRTTELAIMDTSDTEFDDIVVIPESKLRTSERNGETIQSDQLPFDVTCVRFLGSSELEPVNPDQKNLATQGIGLQREAIATTATTGTDSMQTVDFASAYVQLSEKSSGKPLGTYLVSQHLDLRNADTISIDGKPYRIDLRFKTDYKPIAMTLLDVEAEYYLATDTARTYSSTIELSDRKNENSFEHKIWMNNPLRYAGDTFYQSSYGKLPSGTEYTVLQIVKNRGWMIPYVCCMFTVLGLAVQFGSSLLGYLEKQQTKNQTQSKRSRQPGQLANKGHQTLHERADRSETTWKTWLPTLVIAGAFAIYVGNEGWQAQTGTVEKEGMRLDLFGKLPITKDGRVQPLDSFARNTARQLGKRETVKNRNESSQPAICWLADTIFEADGYDEYRLFRIEDPEILAALDLPFPMPTPERDKHSRFRYTLKELQAARSALMDAIPDPQVVDPKSWTVFQTRISDVASKLHKVLEAQLTLGRPDVFDDENLLLQIEQAGRGAGSPLVPLIVPTNDPAKPWISFVEMQNQAWLSSLAKKWAADTTNQLSQKIIAEDILPNLRADMIKGRLIRRFVTDENLLKLLAEQYGESDPVALAQKLESDWDQFPPELLETMETTEGPMVDAMLQQRQPEYELVMAEQLARINGGEGKISASNSELGSLLMKLRPAYLNHDAETFNGTLETYLAAVNDNAPTEMKPYRLATEMWYNQFAPFYLAMVIYCAAFLVGMLAWIGWTPAWNRAACWLLVLGLSIHVIGLVARVVISGRPPVTNLYSSFLFVSAVFVLMLIALERFSKLGIGYVMAGVGGFLALLAAWSMSIIDGDTFAVLVAVLDTQFWLATHVVCISIGYGATLAAGFLGLAFVVQGLVTSSLTKKNRRDFANVIYGVICFGLITSFFGTVLGGLWADDSWGRFWGWDPKENGAMMIVLWNAVSLHARWGGMIRERGLAALAILGNLVVLWSWKGVNAMGVGLHAYAGTEDATMNYILLFGAISCVTLGLAMIPTRYWASYALDEVGKKPLNG